MATKKKLTLEQLLQELQLKTVEALLDKVKSGEADAATLNVARQVLKDNHIECLPEADPNLKDLGQSLPRFVDEDAA